MRVLGGNCIQMSVGTYLAMVVQKAALYLYVSISEISLAALACVQYPSRVGYGASIMQFASPFPQFCKDTMFPDLRTVSA